MCSQAQRRPGIPTPNLQGLAVFHTLRQMRTGANSSLTLVQQPLQRLGVELCPVASRSIVHFFSTLKALRRLRFDFVIFNGLGSISHRNHFAHPLWRIARVLRIPVFVYWHETDWVLSKFVQESGSSGRWVFRLAADPATRHLTASAACSQGVRQIFGNVATTKVFECALVPAPFDRPAKPSKPPMVVNLASIQERKGTDLFVDTAIHVCREHADVEFIWLGAGKAFGNWQDQIIQEGLQSRILFPGHVDAPYLLLRRASVFFLSSRDDPFPLSNLEAMCLGRTVVAFDIGGAPEALAGGGILIPPFDTHRAASAILDCLDQAPESLIRSDLRQRYLERYTPDQMARRLESLFRDGRSHGR